MLGQLLGRINKRRAIPVAGLALALGVAGYLVYNQKFKADEAGVEELPPFIADGPGLFWGTLEDLNGKGLEGVDIALGSYLITSQSGGYFESQAIEPGHYPVRFFKDNETYIQKDSIEGTVSISPGATSSSNFTLFPASLLTGTAHWGMDEVDGTAVADDSGNNNNGTADAGVNVIEGNYGKAREFKGKTTNACIKVTDSASLDIDYYLTISGWFKPSDYNREQYILAKGLSAGGKPAYALKFISGTSGKGNLALEIRAHNLKTKQEATQLITLGRTLPSDTNWHHYAITWNRGVATFFIDGKESVKRDYDIGANGILKLQPDGSGLTLGCKETDAAKGFDGGLDEIRIHNKILSANEIKVLAEY